MNIGDRIRAALATVLDPEIGKDLVTLNMVKDVAVAGDRASVTVELTTPACPLKSKIEADVRAAIAPIGLSALEVKFTANVRGGAAPVHDDPIPGVRNTIAVASGKGGVGKSTVAVNLAAALAADGARVGILDCDVYGPSVPKMTGTEDAKPRAGENRFHPIVRHGIALMSIGYLVPPGQSVVWRGPLVHKAVQQFLSDVEWGDLDYLVIDLPPGTGDVQLSLSQMIPLTGAVMVTTPQEIALLDVRRGAHMFERVKVPLLGVVENMAGFVCPHCRETSEIFDRGGGERVARELGVPFLGAIPLDPTIRMGGDAGAPIVTSDPEGPAGRAFRDAARALAGRVSKLRLGGIGKGQPLPVVR